MFAIVDKKQSMVQVNAGGVPNVAMIVGPGASCNVIDRRGVLVKTAGCFVATVTVRNVTVKAEFTVIEGTRKRDSYTAGCLVPW